MGQAGVATADQDPYMKHQNQSSMRSARCNYGLLLGASGGSHACKFKCFSFQVHRLRHDVFSYSLQMRGNGAYHHDTVVSRIWGASTDGATWKTKP